MDEPAVFYYLSVLRFYAINHHVEYSGRELYPIVHREDMASRRYHDRRRIRSRPYTFYYVFLPPHLKKNTLKFPS